MGEVPPKAEREVSTSTFWLGLQRKWRSKKMANVCSQEEAIDIGSVFPRQVLTNTQTTEDSKEAHPEVIHLLAVLIKIIARPKTIPDTA